MKMLNYNKVQEKIKKLSNGECELISKEYISYDTPLLIKCKCGNIFERTLKKFSEGRTLCPECKKENIRKKYAFTLEEVKKIISEKDCEYISGEYLNNNSKLLIKCKCGNTFTKDLTHFRRGQSHCPTCGNNNLKKSKTKYDLEKVKKELSKKGYVVLDDKYDYRVPINCLCKRGHNVKIKFTFYLRGESGCTICQYIDQRGENHWNYQQGKSEVLDLFRKSIKSWKKKILERDNFKCCVSGETENLEVHHIIPFMEIINIACKVTNIELKQNLKDYKKEEFDILLNKVLELHTMEMGVTLTHKKHREFHSIYGNNNFKLEDFLHFKNNLGD